MSSKGLEQVCEGPPAPFPSPIAQAAAGIPQVDIPVTRKDMEIRLCFWAICSLEQPLHRQKGPKDKVS